MNKRRTKRREEFESYHRCWVDFLNSPVPGQCRNGDNTDLTEATPFFDKFRQERHIVNFHREYDFLVAARKYMLENLKAVDDVGEARNCLQDMDDFSLSEVEAVLSLANLHAEDRLLDGNAGLLGFGIDRFYEKTFLHQLCLYLYRYFEYMGMTFRREPGRLKIGVCRFHYKDEPECGKVFFAREIDSDACAEHSQKWARLKADRKRYRLTQQSAAKSREF